MSVLKSGTRVHVEFDGETVNEPWINGMLTNTSMADSDDCGGFMAVSGPDGIVHLIWHMGDYISGSQDVFTVTPDPEPEFWPPRVGDIWGIPGIEYAVRENWAVPGAVVVDALSRFPSIITGTIIQQTYYEGDGYADYRQLDRFGELHPVLIRRR